jgi:hypothetical protein
MGIAIFVAIALGAGPSWLLVGIVLALLLFLSSLVKPIVGLFCMTAVAAFVGFDQILEARIFIGRMPLNLMDIAVFLALPGLVLGGRLPAQKLDGRRSANFRFIIFALGALFFIGFIRGSLADNWYDAFRDCRSILLLGLSYLLVIRNASSRKLLRRIIFVVLLGGFYGAVMVVVARLTGATQFTSYLDARVVGRGTPAMDFLFATAIAFVLCGYAPFGRRWFAFGLLALSLLTFLLSFSISSYILMIVIPVTAIVVARLLFRRKARIVSWVAVSSILIVLATTEITNLLGIGTMENLTTMIGQAGEQALNLGSSYHAQSRLVAWQAALSQLEGFEWMFGRGMGRRMFLDTGIDEVGIVVAGEPTYSTYLLGIGLIGLLAFMILQVRFVKIAYVKMRSAFDPFDESVMLGLTVYGIITILNGFLHNNFLSPQIPVIFGAMLGVTELIDRPGETEGP